MPLTPFFPLAAPACRAIVLRLAWLVALLGTLAGAQTAFSTRYSNTATTGDILLIGNVNYHCTTDTALATAAQVSSCTSAQSGGNVINNNVYMRPVDTDSTTSTSNSSSASLNLGAGSSVLFAALYWSGNSNSATNRSTVSFATPAGAVSTVTAGQTMAIGNNYQSFANVTAQVQAAGSGVYTVGNIASTAGANSWGGWTLVVAYRNSGLPTRNLSIFDGFQQASSPTAPVDITVSGFITPSVGTVNSTIGVVAYDGDRGQTEGSSATPPGSLRFGPNTATLNTVFNGVNPVNDVFNSTISALGSNVTAGRTPSYTNTLGVDIDTFQPNTPLPNGSTSAVVRVIGTGNDVIYPGVITLATDIFVPNIKDSLVKTVRDVNGGALLPGDVLEYDLYLKNLGNDGALNLTLTDAIPANTTYLPGSLVVALGANSGAKTDAAGDDQGEFDSAGKRIVVRLGSGANATAGGTLLPGEETRVRFRVTVNSGTAGGTVINNSGQITFRQQTLGGQVTDISDSDPNTTGDQPASITVAGPDLRLTKTHTGSFITGQEGTFTLTASNAGPASTTGTVTVTDQLPAGLTATALSGSGWTCTLASLTCTRADTLAAGSAYPPITLSVKPTQSGTLTNTASVSGGGEAFAQTGNNSASDPVTVTALMPPQVTLSKTVRNVSQGGAAETNVGGVPGDTLEYCVTYTNSGGEATNFVLQDTLVNTLTPLPDAYGSGSGLKWTVNGTQTLLTSATDGDVGSLVGQSVSLNLSTLAGGSSGVICFQTKIR